MAKLFLREIVEIDVKYFSDDIDELKFIDGMEKSNWIDVRAAETVELKAWESAKIPLGFGMIIPEGYEALLAPRGSTFDKYGILQTNSIGVIDTSYNGDNDEWMMPVIAVRDTIINKGDRIGQFRLLGNQPYVKFNRVLKLRNKDRGGFGSTGVK